jgi:exodeoxyribonuclease VII large subunit
MITIKQLGEILKKSVPNTLFTIKGEISKPSISGGHMYLTLKDDSSMISCIIWKSKMNENISLLKNGDMVEVKGSVDYYVPRGEIKFIISNITKLDNVGDMQLLFNKLKDEFNIKGYFNKKLTIPKLINSIVLITSLKGAAIHDFIYTINNNKSLLEIIEIDVQVQGSECPKQIIDVLKKNDFSSIDLIVITRGGGSMEDLWGFNNKELIETVFNRNIPILSAIGHMVDTTLLDYVADISCPTPSLAAQYILDYNKKYIDNLSIIKSRVENTIISNINKQINILNNFKHINANNAKKIKDDKMYNFKNIIINLIHSKIRKLEIIKTNHEISQDLSLYNNNLEKLSFEDFNNIIDNNKSFILIWNNKRIKIENYSNF